MIAAGQEFNEAIIGRIRERVETDEGLTRSKLSREVCEWMDWRHGDGRVKDVSSRVALLQLERAGAITLPAAREVGFARRGETGPAGDASTGPVVEMTLAELGPVWLEAVDAQTPERSRRWWSLMEQHPLGGGPLCGGQLRYLIGSRVGYLGGLSFSAPAWRLGARDQWIGWDEAGRKAGLEKVVNNSRFLLLPAVKVPNLASQVLGIALRRLVEDWAARYGTKPVLVETFVDPAFYRGTCYQAANWICLGETTGRGRQDRKHDAERAAKNKKQVWVYPLTADCRAELSGGSEGPRAVKWAPADWAEEEFGGCDLGDARLHERLFTLARDLGAKPTANLPQACGSRAKTKAAYRFFSHGKIRMEKLLAGHYAATEARIKGRRVVLAVQDKTSLNYTSHGETQGLGPLHSAARGAQGLHLHSTLAFDPAGDPQGFLDVQCWARDPAEVRTKGERHRRPIEEKESYNWLQSYQAATAVQARHPGTTLVSVGDREADIYELFRLADATPAGPKLLVRARIDRKLQAEPKEPKEPPGPKKSTKAKAPKEAEQAEAAHLWSTLEALPVAGRKPLTVPRQAQQPERETQLAIRFASVTLAPPRRQPKDAPDLPVWAVLAQEENPPAGIEPVSWMLLTTMPVTNFAEAAEKLDWYALRWGIELLHRTLKSGCKIEQRQLNTATRLEACLAIDLVVAWRIYHLARLGRLQPDALCTIAFDDITWQALMVFTEKKAVPPARPPTMRDALRRIAGLGGFLGRKADGEPGTQTLWLGLQRLDDIVNTYRILRDSFAGP